jgi:L-2-hydroxyglutarate oxidase LhgO
MDDKPNERIVVIGAGVMGILSAFMLKYKYPSNHVTLLERLDDVGKECSF